MLDDSSVALAWAGSLLAGGALGVFFFGGLWWTVRHCVVSSTPARWFLGSLVLRTATVLAGFYVVGAGQPVRLLVCLLGFLLARAVVLRVTRIDPAAQAPPAPRTHGEPPCA